MPMLREHLAAWLTLVFAVLLVMLAVSPATGSVLATALLMLVAAGVVAAWLLVEGSMHPTRQATRRKPRTP